MKKKLISIFLILTFVIVFLPKTAFAATRNNKYYTVYIPDNYEVGNTYKYDTSESESYRTRVDEYPVTIAFDVYKKNYTKTYTQEDVNNLINSTKKSYSNNSDVILTISGKLTELNGLKGYYVKSFVKYKSSGRIYAYVDYRLLSDNYSVYITISSGKNYIGSTTYNKIINSFKIKDTVIKNNGIPYIDVPSNAWYFEDVKYTYKNKLITGYNSNTFGPNDTITRAMIVTILYRMEGSPSVSGSSKFKDVKQNVWHSKAIKWATDKGIVHGYNSEKFGPNDNVRRQDLMVMLRNYAKYKKKNVNVTMNLSKYSDYKKIAPYAKTAVEWAVKNEILKGGNGKLNPQGTATRAETAAFIHRYCIKIGR